MAKINRFWPALVSRLIIAISSLREIVLVGWVYFNKIQSPWKNYVRFHYYLLYCYYTEPTFASAPRSSPAGLDHHSWSHLYGETLDTTDRSGRAKRGISRGTSCASIEIV